VNEKFDERCKVLDNRCVVNDFWTIKLHCPQIAGRIVPGQFVMLQVGDSTDPILRRPLTVSRIYRHEGAILILYRSVGKGTEIMTQWKQGDACQVLGPLGNGFTIPKGAKKIAVLGRDIGIGPLLALIDEAVLAGVEVYAFLSSQYQEVLKVTSLGNGGCEASFFADNGKWQCGPFMTRKLEQIADSSSLDQIYIGGLCKFCPSCSLIKGTHRIGRKLGIDVQVSLDQYMACGLGACHGCIIELYEDQSQKSKSYKRVCKEGPVFITWEVVENG
jgi:dihydroorotate dehydrogenase electron transfer subunit